MNPLPMMGVISSTRLEKSVDKLIGFNRDN